MAECQQPEISVVDSSKKTSSENGDSYLKHMFTGASETYGFSNKINSDYEANLKVNRSVTLGDDEDAVLLESHRKTEEHDSTKFLPRLVFLDSDENIADDTQGGISNIEYRQKERAVSDSVVNRGRGLQTLNENHLSESSSHGGLYQTRRARTSQLSLQSSDSELLLDHGVMENSSIPGDEEFERFIMEYPTTTDHPRLKTWHCHSIGTKLPADNMARNQLIAVSILCFLFMVGETVGGVISNSLALFTDVLHLGSDLISFLISLLAIYLSKKPATRNMTFGYHRTEVLGALFSVFIIWMVTGILVYMAVERIQQEHYKNVKANEMLVTAVVGVIFNIVMGIVLHSEVCFRGSASGSVFGHGHSHGHSHGPQKKHRSSSSGQQRNGGVTYERIESDEENPDSPDDHILERRHEHSKNINVRAAFIHVVGDIIQSMGVLVAALIIKLKPEEKYKLADPICTFLFSLLVLLTTITVLRDTLLIIMEGVPRDIQYYAIKNSLQKLEGVKAVHGLTVWSLTVEKNALAVHLAVDPAINQKLVLSLATDMLRKNYNFIHTTIQVEDHIPEIIAQCSNCTELRK